MSWCCGGQQNQHVGCSAFLSDFGAELYGIPAPFRECAHVHLESHEGARLISAFQAVTIQHCLR